MKRTRSYARYSAHKQDDGYSIEYQMTEINEFVQRHNLRLEYAHIDQAQTATKVAGREEFFALMNAVKSGEVDVIVVYKMNRMFRNAYESQKYRKLLRKHNVAIMSITENIDETTSSGRLMTNVLSDIDQYQSETISDHVKSSMREMARQGYYTGGVIQYGFTLSEEKNGTKMRKRLIPHEEESAIVRKIFELYANGFSLFKIQKYLIDNGIKTRNGNTFIMSYLSRMLSAEIYLGTLRFRTHGYDTLIMPDCLPPIIDRETWDKVQRRKQNFPVQPRRRSKEDSKRLNSLTGFIVCGYCGDHFVGKSSGNKKNNPSLAPRRYYTCKKKNRFRMCNAANISKEHIEKVVLEAITEQILNEDAIHSLSEEIMKTYSESPAAVDEKAKSLKREKSKIEKRIDNLIEMQLDGKKSAEIIKKKTEEAELELLEIESNLRRLDDQQKNIVTQEGIQSYLFELLSCVPTTDQDVLRLIFETFVEKVILTDSEIKIFLKVNPSFSAHNGVNGRPFRVLYAEMSR